MLLAIELVVVATIAGVPEALIGAWPSVPADPKLMRASLDNWIEELTLILALTSSKPKVKLSPPAPSVRSALMLTIALLD